MQRFQKALNFSLQGTNLSPHSAAPPSTAIEHFVSASARTEGKIHRVAGRVNDLQSKLKKGMESFESSLAGCAVPHTEWWTF